MNDMTNDFPAIPSEEEIQASQIAFRRNLKAREAVRAPLREQALADIRASGEIDVLAKRIARLVNRSTDVSLGPDVLAYVLEELGDKAAERV